MEARALPAHHHEFPDRLEHHGYLPGEPRLLPGPPASLFRPQSRLLAAQRCGLAGVSPPAPPRPFGGARGGFGVCCVRSSALVGRRPAAVPPHPASTHFPVEFRQGSGGLRQKGAAPTLPTAPLSRASGKLWFRRRARWANRSRLLGTRGRRGFAVKRRIPEWTVRAVPGETRPGAGFSRDVHAAPILSAASAVRVRSCSELNPAPPRGKHSGNIRWPTLHIWSSSHIFLVSQ